MSSKAITEKPEDRPAPGGWKPFRESAPSVVSQEQPTIARMFGIFGLFMVGLAVAALLLKTSGFQSWIGAGRSAFLIVAGLACMLFHAAIDRELQVRRLYGIFGFLLLVLGIALPLLPIKGVVGELFGYGYGCLALALLFLMAFVRNETEVNARDLTIRALGLAGIGLALVGFVGGNVNVNFLIPYGVLLALLGTAYLWAFVSIKGVSDDLGYRAGLGMIALGLLVFLVALGRTALPPLFFAWGWLKPPAPEPYLIPSGLLLMALGLLYATVGAFLTSDNPLLVLTRRELAAYFYSPIAYIVLFGLTVVGWFLFWSFVSRVLEPDRPPLVEPIVRSYIIQWWPIICVIFVVPVITMRLLSEEHRTGTLEVLFTAPVDETSVVLSKFLAALIFFLLIWVPWGLFLVALRVEAGTPFDYRPLLSFFIGLVATGSGFLAMGLFFSSLTRNQIASAILTFAGMLALTFVFFAKMLIEEKSASSPWVTVLNHMSYIDIWINTLDGQLVPKFLLFHLSAAVLWLFMTVKVLEARRWT